jgi:hypothetical protein
VPRPIPADSPGTLRDLSGDAATHGME